MNRDGLRMLLDLLQDCTEKLENKLTLRKPKKHLGHLGMLEEQFIL